MNIFHVKRVYKFVAALAWCLHGGWLSLCDTKFKFTLSEYIKFPIAPHIVSEAPSTVAGAKSRVSYEILSIIHPCLQVCCTSMRECSPTVLLAYSGENKRNERQKEKLCRRARADVKSLSRDFVILSAWKVNAWGLYGNSVMENLFIHRPRACQTL